MGRLLLAVYHSGWAAFPMGGQEIHMYETCTNCTNMQASLVRLYKQRIETAGCQQTGCHITVYRFFLLLYNTKC